MSQGVVPIEPGELLKKLVEQLQQQGRPAGSNLRGGAFGDLAFLTVWPDDVLLQNPRGNRFVAVRPSRFPLWQTVVQGAGAPVSGYQGENTMTGFNAVVSLLLFNQNNADPENKSLQAVTEVAIGFLSLALRVFAAVQFWNPFPPASRATKYLREPARVTDGGFSINPRNKGDSWWTTGVIDVEMKFTCKFPANMGEG